VTAAARGATIVARLVMMIFAPIGWNPETNGSVLWRHPPGCMRCLPAAPRDARIAEILWVIYWTVAGRDPTADECEANRPMLGDVRELFALFDRIEQHAVDVVLQTVTGDRLELHVDYATTNGWRLQVTYEWDARAWPDGAWQRRLAGAVDRAGERVPFEDGVQQRWIQICSRFPETFLRTE
jgi:hypothetical protein